MNDAASEDPASINQTENCDQTKLIMADPGQADFSPLFGVLPVELRLQIYEELFAGSKASYKKKHTIGSRTELNILLPSDHYNFLLTCRQAYNEALMTYWSQTTLYGDPDDNDSVHFLGSVVPDIAKPRIKHIRGLNSCELPNLPLEECLKDYQRLQSIGFEEEWFINVASLGDHGASPTMQEWAEEHCLGQSSWKFSKLVRGGGPAVVFRGVYRIAIGVCSLDLVERKFPDVVEDYQNQHKVNITFSQFHIMKRSLWIHDLEGANSLILR